MTTKMLIMSLGVGALLLGGCGSSDVEDEVIAILTGTPTTTTTPTLTTTTTPTTTTAAQASIVGNYASGCKDNAPGSIQEELTIEAGGTGTFRGREYTALGCNAADLDVDEMGVFTYVVGAKVQAADGDDAFELDVTENGITEYLMVRFDANGLQFSNDSAGRDGTSPATRFNDFSGGDAITRL